jgi:lysosomal alpha-mannosidase
MNKIVKRIIFSLFIKVHRRLHHDDAFGVGEALNEIAFGEPLVARGRHIIVLGSLTDTPTGVAQQRQISMQQMVLAPWMLLTPTDLSHQDWTDTYKTEV